MGICQLIASDSTTSFLGGPLDGREVHFPQQGAEGGRLRLTTTWLSRHDNSDKIVRLHKTLYGLWPRRVATDCRSVRRRPDNHWRRHGSLWKIQEGDVKELQDERSRCVQLLSRHRSAAKYCGHHHLSKCVGEEAARHSWTSG